jgi:hypothetical protein
MCVVQNGLAQSTACSLVGSFSSADCNMCSKPSWLRITPPISSTPSSPATTSPRCRRKWLQASKSQRWSHCMKKQRAPQLKSNLRTETLHWWMQSCSKVCVLRCKQWQCSQCHVGSQRAALQPKQARVQVRHCFQFLQQRVELHSPVAQAATR